ncbi:MAG: rhomboid family intramembrane serine protease [Dehalococcoidales bacterium]
MRPTRVRFSGFGGPNMNPIWVIMGANFLVMVAYTINQRAVVDNFGLTPAIWTEQPWTLLTSMFIHAGFLHILMNMLMLYFFGRFVLGLLGENRFLFIYFVGGLAGSLVFVLIGPEFRTAVGASGALYAVMGTLAVLRPRIKVLVFFMIPVDLWMVVVAGALIVSQGIAWQAHLGGLALGLAAGFHFRKKERGSYWR